MTPYLIRQKRNALDKSLEHLKWIAVGVGKDAEHTRNILIAYRDLEAKYGELVRKHRSMTQMRSKWRKKAKEKP